MPEYTELMIKREEIKEKAVEFDIEPANVERDYVFGWILAGIYGASPLRDILILKGGNGFRKAYFPTTRFSNDLDFSTEQAVTEAFLTTELNKVCEFVQERAGVEFEIPRNKVEEKALSDKSRTIYEARLYFKDFFGNPNKCTISIRLDVTEFDRIYLPVQERRLIHPYSDASECAIRVRCLKLEEMLAAKLKCLLQRRHSFDLYDYVHAIFVNKELAIDRGEVVSTFLRKTIFEPSPRSAAGLLLGLPFQVLKGAWESYIVCPKGGAIEFDTALSRFTQDIRELFGVEGAAYVDLPYFPPEMRNPIMEAGSGMRLMAVTYHGVRRTVEPYALVFKRRKDGAGQEYFYAWDRTGGRSGPGIKTFLRSDVEQLEILEETFEPQFTVELAKAGEFGDRTYFGKGFGSGISRAGGRRGGYSGVGVRVGPTYVVECAYCGRTFKRSKRDSTMREHKDQYGNRCFGRRGVVVSIEM